jgi:hypothetical protein
VGLCFVLSSTLASAGNWLPIGERTVDERTTEESIDVANTSSFKEIKLQVRTTPLKIVTVKVEFRDGTSFDATLDSYLPPGVFTKVIELPAAKSIQKVTFTHKKVGSSANPAVVRLHATT